MSNTFILSSVGRLPRSERGSADHGAIERFFFPGKWVSIFEQVCEMLAHTSRRVAVVITARHRPASRHVSGAARAAVSIVSPPRGATFRSGHTGAGSAVAGIQHHATCQTLLHADFTPIQTVDALSPGIST